MKVTLRVEWISGGYKVFTGIKEDIQYIDSLLSFPFNGAQITIPLYQVKIIEAIPQAEDV